MKCSKYKLLPEPWTNITIDFESITQSFQDIHYVGELRQRWYEIKKLQQYPMINLTNAIK